MLYVTIKHACCFLMRLQVAPGVLHALPERRRPLAAGRVRAQNHAGLHHQPAGVGWVAATVFCCGQPVEFRLCKIVQNFITSRLESGVCWAGCWLCPAPSWRRMHIAGSPVE